MKLNLSGISVDAVSVGSVGTCIQLPSMKLAFDMGNCSAKAASCEFVLLTHTHIDHINDLCFHAARRQMQKLSKPTYIVGKEYAEALEELFAAMHKLDGSTMDHNLVVIGPGDQWALPDGRLIKPFRSPHSRPCQGYSIWNKKIKLKPDYQGLPPNEIVDLRKRGEEINDVIWFPEVSFTGDTMIDVVEREETVRKSKLLIMEVTFWDNKVSVASAREHGHVHVDEVLERESLFENDSILFTHYSARYSPEEVKKFFEEKFANSKLKDRITVLEEKLDDWDK